MLSPLPLTAIDQTQHHHLVQDHKEALTFWCNGASTTIASSQSSIFTRGCLSWSCSSFSFHDSLLSRFSIYTALQHWFSTLSNPSHCSFLSKRRNYKIFFICCQSDFYIVWLLVLQCSIHHSRLRFSALSPFGNMPMDCKRTCIVTNVVDKEVPWLLQNTQYV